MSNRRSTIRANPRNAGYSGGMHEDILKSPGMPGNKNDRAPQRSDIRTGVRTRTARTLPSARVTIDGHEVMLTVKRIKNIYLRIKPPDGHIEVSAPANVSMGTLAEFLHTRSAWIDQQQERVRAAATRTGNALNAGSATHGIFDGWDDARKREAKAIISTALPGLLAKWEAIIGKAPASISLRLMTTRWGSCTPATARIRLNLVLAFMPPRFLEYVLVHELTHLWAKGHGREFQRRMDLYLPDWRAIRKELNRDYVL